jgi:hypothetical protein
MRRLWSERPQPLHPHIRLSMVWGAKQPQSVDTPVLLLSQSGSGNRVPCPPLTHRHKVIYMDHPTCKLFR